MLTYHYLPMNAIASYRPAGFAQNLHKFGIYPTIITHRWEFSETGGLIWHKKGDDIIIEENKECRIIRLPLYVTRVGLILRFLNKYYFTRQATILLKWICGFFDAEPHNLDSYLIYRKFLRTHLDVEKYDICTGIFSPHHHLKMCFEINKKFGIQYYLDFRDLWDNKATSSDYSPSGTNKIYVWLVKKYWSKWLSRSTFFTSISQIWIDQLGKLTDVPGHRIMHGYDEDIDNLVSSNASNASFTLLYVGSLYKNQDIEGFLQGVNMFIKNSNLLDFKLILLGSKRDNNMRNFQSDIELLLNKYLNPNKFLLTKRVSRLEVLDYYRKASVLVSLTYDAFPGTYGGKLFEYIGTRKPILAFPNDKGVICKTIIELGVGEVANRPEDLADILNTWYNEWEEKGRINLNANLSKMEEYSRVFQTQLLSNIIISITT